MVIRVAAGRYDPAQFEELRRYAQEHFAPALQALSGFRSYTAGFDPVEGYFLGVSVWDTEERAQVATETLARVRAAFPLSRPDSPGQVTRYYEVIAQA